MSAAIVTRPVPVADTRPLRQRVLRPHETLDELAAGEPDGALAIGAFSGEDLVAVGLIAVDREPDVWRVRGMAAEPWARGQGAGSAVLAALLRHADDRGARRIWCSARVPALSLYERAGFEPCSAEYVKATVGPHVDMERVTAAP